jgi:hypothetical protein
MKQSKFTFLTFAALTMVMLAVGFMSSPVYSKAETALMIQQSPASGGEINIGTGVHYYGSGSEVTLVATPKPGYRFVYWLGDVSDETSNNTTAQLDNPKIIIAVYEREEYAFLEETSFVVQGAAAADRMTAAPQASGKDLPSVDPNPDDPDDPKPTPEPVTGLLFALGGLMVARRKAKKA